MEQNADAIAAVFALTRAFIVLCSEMDKRGIIKRSQLAELMQEDYLHEQLTNGHTEEFLAAYRQIAVQLGPVPGASA